MPDNIQLARMTICATLLAILLLFGACDGGQKPIDGKTRQVMDSLIAAGIRDARIEVDSICARERRERLPVLVDSILRQRQREIDEKLRNIPR